MDKQSRRDAVRDYKERKVAAGIFSLRCTATGETWVGASRNLDQMNGVYFSLRMGSHRNAALQAAWKAHGEAGFDYAVVESLDDDDLTPIGRASWLKDRERHWMATLNARPMVA